MAAIEVKVPDIGDFKDVPVIELLVKPGDRVEKESSLVTLESDKATMEVPSPSAGTVKELRVKLGDKVSQGTVIAVLDTADAGAAAAKPVTPAPARHGGCGASSWSPPRQQPAAARPTQAPAGR